MSEPWLLLNGEEQGPIGTACVLSEVAPTYAPAGRALISVSLSEQTASVEKDQHPAVRAQLHDGSVRQWTAGGICGPITSAGRCHPSRCLALNRDLHLRA